MLDANTFETWGETGLERIVGYVISSHGSSVLACSSESICSWFSNSLSVVSSLNAILIKSLYSIITPFGLSAAAIFA